MPVRFLSFLSILFGMLAPVEAASGFDFADVAARAKKLAAMPYKAPAANLPASLRNLGYDQYRDIRFDPARARWRNSGLPFELAFYHPGRRFDTPVKINEIAGARVRPIPFEPKHFDYGKNDLHAKDMAGLDFAGFRAHYPINTPKYKDEVIVFLGASYFRAVGRNQWYGLSARGLAIDTALPSGEEFPHFVEFWIERPAVNAKELTIYALLDSPRLTGAYRFIVRPGIDTVIDVKARLHLRADIAKLGIAPLTGMFFFGENQPGSAADYRPEVHDIDGLSIASGTGEWIWRPLVNPKRLLVTSFSLSNPAGFGLQQRDRRFSSFEDLEARYDLRPSVWVEPKGQWGDGRVELVLIPTPDETNDNVVAFWVPQTPPRAGTAMDVEYRLLWQMEQEKRPPLAWVAQSRRGHGWLEKPDNSIAFSVDFEGAALQKLPSDAPVQAIVSVDGNGRLVEVNTIRNNVTGGWRMTVRLHRIDEKKPVELRGFLHANHTTLSETWSYILPGE